jgi:hypothetical protein
MWYLLSTICQDVEEWNMSTKYVSKFAQPCKCVPMVSNSLKLKFLLNPSTSLLNVLVWCLTSKSYFWKMKTHLANFHVNQFKTLWTFQWLVIDYQGEWATKQITSRCGHEPNKYQTFTYIWVLLGFCLVIGLICISQHKILIFLIKLCKGCPKSQSALIHMQLKRMTFNGSPQNGCKTKLNFELLKNLFLCIPPYKLLNLGQLS